MNKLEFLVTSLPNGVKMIHEKSGRIIQLIGLRVFKMSAVYNDVLEYFDEDQSYFSDNYNFKPIVRTFSDLTKECVQADYNEGNPFVPMGELLKMSEKIYYNSYKEDSRYREIEYSQNGICAQSWFKYSATKSICIDTQFPEYYPTWITRQLLKWHFDLLDEPCEKVYVTEEFNPYK